MKRGESPPKRLSDASPAGKNRAAVSTPPKSSPRKILGVLALTNNKKRKAKVSTGIHGVEMRSPLEVENANASLGQKRDNSSSFNGRFESLKTSTSWIIDNHVKLLFEDAHMASLFLLFLVGMLCVLPVVCLTGITTFSWLKGNEEPQVTANNAIVDLQLCIMKEMVSKIDHLDECVAFVEYYNKTHTSSAFQIIEDIFGDLHGTNEDYQFIVDPNNQGYLTLYPVKTDIFSRNRTLRAFEQRTDSAIVTLRSAMLDADYPHIAFDVLADVAVTLSTFTRLVPQYTNQTLAAKATVGARASMLQLQMLMRYRVLMTNFQRQVPWRSAIVDMSSLDHTNIIKSEALSSNARIGTAMSMNQQIIFTNQFYSSWHPFGTATSFNDPQYKMDERTFIAYLGERPVNIKTGILNASGAVDIVDITSRGGSGANTAYLSTLLGMDSTAAVTAILTNTTLRRPKIAALPVNVTFPRFDLHSNLQLQTILADAKSRRELLWDYHVQGIKDRDHQSDSYHNRMLVSFILSLIVPFVLCVACLFMFILARHNRHSQTSELLLANFSHLEQQAKLIPLKYIEVIQSCNVRSILRFNNKTAFWGITDGALGEEQEATAATFTDLLNDNGPTPTKKGAANQKESQPAHSLLHESILSFVEQLRPYLSQSIFGELETLSSAVIHGAATLNSPTGNGERNNFGANSMSHSNSGGALGNGNSNLNAYYSYGGDFGDNRSIVSGITLETNALNALTSSNNISLSLPAASSSLRSTAPTAYISRTTHILSTGQAELVGTRSNANEALSGGVVGERGFKSSSAARAHDYTYVIDSKGTSVAIDKPTVRVACLGDTAALLERHVRDENNSDDEFDYYNVTSYGNDRTALLSPTDHASGFNNNPNSSDAVDNNSQAATAVVGQVQSSGPGVFGTSGLRLLTRIRRDVADQAIRELQLRDLRNNNFMGICYATVMVIDLAKINNILGNALARSTSYIEGEPLNFEQWKQQVLYSHTEQLQANGVVGTVGDDPINVGNLIATDPFTGEGVVQQQQIWNSNNNPEQQVLFRAGTIAGPRQYPPLSLDTCVQRPEETAVFSRFLSDIEIIINGHGGIIASAAGDTIFAHWNVSSTPPTNTAEVAVNCALEVVKASDHQMAQLGISTAGSSSVSIGIAQGRVTTGNVDSSPHRRIGFTSGPCVFLAQAMASANVNHKTSIMVDRHCAEALSTSAARKFCEEQPVALIKKPSEQLRASAAGAAIANKKRSSAFGRPVPVDGVNASYENMSNPNAMRNSHFDNLYESLVSEDCIGFAVYLSRRRANQGDATSVNARQGAFLNHNANPIPGDRLIPNSFIASPWSEVFKKIVVNYSLLGNPSLALTELDMYRVSRGLLTSPTGPTKSRNAQADAISRNTDPSAMAWGKLLRLSEAYQRAQEL